MQVKRLSWSLLNRFHFCGEQLRRILEGERLPPGIAALKGRGVHYGAEVNFKAKRISGNDEPLDVIQDASRDRYVRDVHKDGVFIPWDERWKAKKLLAEGLDYTIRQARNFRENVAPKIQPNRAEHRIEMEVEGLPVPVMGFIDVVDTRHWIPDLKVLKNKWNQGKAFGSLQSVFYSELYRHETGVYPAFTYECLGENSKGFWNESFEGLVGPEHWKRLILRLKTVCHAIQEGIFPPADPGHWVCSPKFCGFYFTCPYISPRMKDTNIQLKEEVPNGKAQTRGSSLRPRTQPDWGLERHPR